MLNFIFEKARSDYELVVVSAVLALTKRFAEVVGVCGLFVDELELAIDAQRFEPSSVESLSCGCGLLQHDDWSAG